MKNKLIKVISSVLAFLMIFGTVIRNLSITETYAKENVIKNILVYKTTIQHGEYFRLDVEFGGAGTKVKNGQTERIEFTLERKDKAEFEAKDGEEIKRGISIKLVTNADGVINVKDLRAGDYIL